MLGSSSTRVVYALQKLEHAAAYEAATSRAEGLYTSDLTPLWLIQLRCALLTHTGNRRLTKKLNVTPEYDRCF